MKILIIYTYVRSYIYIYIYTYITKVGDLFNYLATGFLYDRNFVDHRISHICSYV